jgi:putative addiction module CopG family antidote
MEVQLTDDQKAFIRQGIEAGRYSAEEDALRDALALWEARERARTEILSAVDIAEASLANGGGRITTRESMRELASDVKQRGRVRLAGDRLSAHSC